MIVATKDDVVRLSGSLNRNQWLTIKAAANLLLKQFPEGIAIDCSELSEITEEGAKTFLDATRDIQGAGARIMVCHLPENVISVLRGVPGVRSQLPIAASLEEARASLKLAQEATSVGTEGMGAESPVLLLPLMPEIDVPHAVDLACRMSAAMGTRLHVVYLLEVARYLPLGTPLIEEEARANETISMALRSAKQHNVPISHFLERVRDADDGVFQAIKSHRAKTVVFGAFTTNEADERFYSIAARLLRRAPCEVIIGRLGAPTPVMATEQVME